MKQVFELGPYIGINDCNELPICLWDTVEYKDVISEIIYLSEKLTYALRRVTTGEVMSFDSDFKPENIKIIPC